MRAGSAQMNVHAGHAPSAHLYHTDETGGHHVGEVMFAGHPVGSAIASVTGPDGRSFQTQFTDERLHDLLHAHDAHHDSWPAIYDAILEHPALEEAFTPIVHAHIRSRAN